MIHGACAGAGCGLSLACDLRFAAAGARLGITPARIGAAYPFADIKALVDLVGPARAKHILFSGALIDAAEAQAIGLVDFVHPDADARSRGHRLCPKPLRRCRRTRSAPPRR